MEIGHGQAQTKAEIEKVKGELTKAKDVTNVLLLHNSVKGAKSYGWECDNGLVFSDKDFSDGIDYVFSGHFHDSQVFWSIRGKPRGWYLGSPMDHHFGDSPRKQSPGLWMMDFCRDGHVSSKKIDLNGPPRFYQIDSSKVVPELKDNDYIEISVRGTRAEWLASLPMMKMNKERLSKRGIKVFLRHVPKYSHETRLDCFDDKGRSLSMDRLVRDYVGAIKEVGSLDRDRLKEIGTYILKTERAKHETVVS